MRCPECAERNSVAARKCEFCGTKFKKKPLPLGLKLACGGVAVAVTASIAASYLVPHLADPQQSLQRVAKRMAAGPKLEEVAKIKKEFSVAIKDYLKTAGDDKTEKLTASLQKLLPSNAYEVHVVDLPRGLRVVEVDTVLQANAFLVMNTSAGTKVFDLPGFEVFDDARILNDSAGPVLALLGHTGGPPPHKPILRTYALLPDYIADETEKLVPPLKVIDGTARFAANGNDVHLEFNTTAVATGKKPARTSDKLAYGMLKWKDARYVSDFGATAAQVAAKQVKQAVSAMPAPVIPSAPVIASVPVVPTAPAAVAQVKTPAIAPTTIPTPVATVAPAQKIVVRSFTAADQARSNGLRTAVSAAGAAVPTATTSGAGTIAASNAVKQAANTLVTSDSVLAAVPNSVPTINNLRTTYKSLSDAYGSTSKKKSAEVICSGATLRSMPARGAAAMNSFGRGTKVTVLGKESDWYHVRVNGQEGYIYAPLLSVSSSSGSSTTSGASTQTAYSAPAPAAGTSRRSRRRHTEVAVVADATADRRTSRRHRREKPQVAASEPILVP